jgi:nucleoside-diphosphate-sugar epimerase
MSRPRLVVTGATGHIGSRLIHALRPGEFDRVTLVDDLSTQRYASLMNLPAGVDFDFHEEDICEADLTRRFEGHDVVVHLAAITDAVSSVRIAERVHAVNWRGTERVAQACAQTGCRLVFTSTTSVYGQQDGRVDEDCPESLLRPQSPYADSKLRAERALQRLGAEGRLRFVTCRLGTIFGPSIGMRFHTAVNKFIWQACTGQPLTVWRTAMDQKRPYLDLDDAVAALRFVVAQGVFPNAVYNVVTRNATVTEIVDAIRDQVPQLRVTLVDEWTMNQLSYEVACEKFKALGFEFKGDLRTSIAQTLRLLAAATGWERQAVT